MSLNHKHLVDRLDINEFIQLCKTQSLAKDYPLAATIEKSIPVYEAETLLKNYDAALQELGYCLDKGAGIFIIKRAFKNLEVVDNYSQVIQDVIDEEKQQESNKGDHFADPGANDRVWNALQKCCLKNPKAHVDYYSNELLALASRSWLGPNYLMTSQVNIVKPGAKAQQPHRDYHLGFQSDDTVNQYPLHTQKMSCYLTLQGGVAHSDMPLESGPTKLLPYSQRYEWGYLAWRQPEFMAYFEANFVQLPLEKGDALFFNPALFHAAGSNVTSDIHRSANLFQVSSAFGKPMESLDHEAICLSIYQPLLEAVNHQGLSEGEIHAVITASADGYSFPTNLDLDQPVDGCASQTMQELLTQAIAESWPVERFKEGLEILQKTKVAIPEKG